MLSVFKKKGTNSTTSLKVHIISEKYFKKVYAELSGLGFRDAVQIPFKLKDEFDFKHVCKSESFVAL